MTSRVLTFKTIVWNFLAWLVFIPAGLGVIISLKTSAIDLSFSGLPSLIFFSWGAFLLYFWMLALMCFMVSSLVMCVLVHVRNMGKGMRFFAGMFFPLLVAGYYLLGSWGWPAFASAGWILIASGLCFFNILGKPHEGPEGRSIVED